MMQDAFSYVKLGSGRLEVGGGECGCGLWLDYGRDMLIMLHTLFSAYFLIFMTGETQLKISNPGMRSYATHTPFVRHFIRCSFFSGKYFIGGKCGGKGFRIIGLFPILILGYGSRQLVLVRSAMVQVR